MDDFLRCIRNFNSISESLFDLVHDRSGVWRASQLVSGSLNADEVIVTPIPEAHVPALSLLRVYYKLNPSVGLVEFNSSPFLIGVPVEKCCSGDWGPNSYRPVSDPLELDFVDLVEGV